MNKLHSHLLSLLKEIDEICRQNSISYFIDGGTALGAVRHRGFLPWDDDIDIMLTRENWEKFRKVVNENPRPNRVLEDMNSNKEYTMVYGRYCDTSTTCILRTSMMDQFQSGLFIDMFILDPIPDTQESRKEYFDILHAFCEFLNPYYYDTVISSSEWYDVLKKMGETQGKQAVIDYVERKLFSYPDDENMIYAFRYDNGHWFYPRDVVGVTGKLIEFEGTLLPAAQRIEDYLRIHYGDHWNIIPFVEDAETHNVVIDLDIPYQQFVDNYISQIDRKKTLEIYNDLHELRIEQRRITEKIDVANYTTTSKLFCHTLNKHLENLGMSLREMLSNKDYGLISQTLNNYFDMQLNRWYLSYRVFVPLTDEQLYCALYLLLVGNDYSKADKILAIRKEQPEELSEDLQSIEELIKTMRNIVCYFEQKDFQEVLHTCLEYEERHPDITFFTANRLKAEALLCLNENAEDRAHALMTSMNNQYRAFLEEEHVRAAVSMLHIRFSTGQDQNSALLELRGLKQNSRDGMLRLEIQDFLDVEGYSERDSR